MRKNHRMHFKSCSAPPNTTCLNGVRLNIAVHNQNLHLMALNFGQQKLEFSDLVPAINI